MKGSGSCGGVLGLGRSWWLGMRGGRLLGEEKRGNGGNWVGRGGMEERDSIIDGSMG